VKSFLPALVSTLILGCGGGEPPAVGSSSPSGLHLVYLHGQIVEDEGPRPTHPQFGVYEFREILDRFAEAGFEVIGEKRSPGTVPSDYARTVRAQVEGLIAGGVPPENITVAGFSKGGGIAILSALELDDPRINYVFIACCGPWLDRLIASGDETIRGRMLSIYEASDEVGSCSELFALASDDSVIAEIELRLGGGHGAFFRPHPEWIDPVVSWARHGEAATASSVR
jgi:hypothetical protein